MRRRRTIYIYTVRERERAIGERVFSSYVCALRVCVCVMSLNECKRNEEKFFSPRRAATWSDGYISHNSAPLQKRRLLTTTTTARERERLKNATSLEVVIVVVVVVVAKTTDEDDDDDEDDDEEEQEDQCAFLCIVGGKLGERGNESRRGDETRDVGETSHVSRRRLRRRTRSAAAAAILLLESHRTERDEAHQGGSNCSFSRKRIRPRREREKRRKDERGVRRNGRCAGVIGYGAGVDGREREKVFGGFGW